MEWGTVDGDGGSIDGDDLDGACGGGRVCILDTGGEQACAEANKASAQAHVDRARIAPGRVQPRMQRPLRVLVRLRHNNRRCFGNGGVSARSRSASK
jgi:hypothetical protein